MGRFRRGVSGVAALVAALAASGCAVTGPGSSERRQPAGPSVARTTVRMSFGQLPSQIGTDHGLLRVVNPGRRDLPVRRVGLDWRGYGDRFLRGEDNVLGPGQTVDFPVTLPAPRCTDVSGPVLGVVDIGAAQVSVHLDREGTVLLRRNWQQGCAEVFVRERLRVAYGGAWQVTGHGAEAVLSGDLRLSRIHGDDPVRLVGTEGSVLYDLDLPGRSVLPSGATAANVPLRITPGNRCDEHAHSQATAPFSFRLLVTIGGRRASVGLPPPPWVQALAPELLRRACR